MQLFQFAAMQKPVTSMKFNGGDRSIKISQTFSACSGAFCDKSCITPQTALSSLLNGAGNHNGLKSWQHQISQYNINMCKYKSSEATCSWKKFGVGG